MTDINTAKNNMGHTGYLDIDIDVNIDLFAEIERWMYLLWDDYVEFKREEERRKKLLIP